MGQRPPPGLILMEGPLKRTHQHPAFGAIAENDAQARIEASLIIREDLAFFCGVGFCPPTMIAAWFDFGL
jgi:hypothetical protein